MKEKFEFLNKPAFYIVTAFIGGFLVGCLFLTCRGKNIGNGAGPILQGQEQGQNIRNGQQQGNLNRDGSNTPQMTGIRAAGYMVLDSNEVSSVDSSSITVKTSDGTLKKITVSADTKLYKASEASLSDITNGSKIMISNTIPGGSNVSQTIIVGLSK